MNEDYFRQAEVKCKIDALEKIKTKDSALDAFQSKVVNTLLADLEVTQADQKARPPESYVDQYGQESKGFINLKEFLEIYTTHVHYADTLVGHSKVPLDEAKVRGLFNAIDANQR